MKKDLFYWIDEITSNGKRICFFVVIVFFIGVFCFIYVNIDKEKQSSLLFVLGWFISRISVPIVLLLLLAGLQKTNILLEEKIRKGPNQERE